MKKAALKAALFLNTRGGIRTCGLLLRRQALYPLSYAGISERDKDNGCPDQCQS